jgi:hypothetical protein
MSGRQNAQLDAASRRPRAQQQKIAAVLEPFILQDAGGA